MSQMYLGQHGSTRSGETQDRDGRGEDRGTPDYADMTPEERSAMLSRVYVIEPGIVFYRELPEPSVESIDLMLGRLYELGCQWPTFIEVLDLSKAIRPTPPVRAVIKSWMLRLAPRMAHLCIIVESNFV